MNLPANVSFWRQAGILAAITFAVFSPTLSADFVYDARLQILTDPFPHDPRNWPAVLSFSVLGMDVLDFNRPVHLASIMLDAAIWGRNPFGYHLTSILLHCGNVVLVWAVLRDVLSRGARASDAAARVGDGPTATDVAAFAGALLFAVHPIVAEAVCEPTFREDLLVAAFTLGALVLASQAGGITVDAATPSPDGSPERKRRHSGALGETADGCRRLPWRAVGCAACCLLACGSKESGIAAPLVLAAYWWLFRRTERGRFWTVAIGGGTALAIAFLTARFLLEPANSTIFETKPSYPDGSFARAMLIEPRILALYAQLVVCPVNLCADYCGDSIRHLPLGLAIPMLAALVAGLTWAGWRDRRIAFGAALVLLPLLPVSNLVPIYRAAADRYLYVPLAGVAVVFAAVVANAWVLLPRERRPAGLGAGLIVLALLVWGCTSRQKVWSNSLALWLDTAARSPSSYSAANGLANAFWGVGDFTNSERAARHALRVSGSSRGDTWVGLALALDGQGRTTEADAAIATALAKDPRLADPDCRVAALAMDRVEAEALKKLLARQGPAPTPETPTTP